MVSNQTSVLLVEDDPSTRERLSLLIISRPELKLLGAASTARHALEMLTLHDPDVVLVDLGLPDRSGIEVIRWLARNKPACECIVISVFGDESHVISSIEAGATGYLLKESTGEELAKHIAQVRNGGSPISPVIARQLLKRYQQSKPAEPAEPTSPGHQPTSQRQRAASQARPDDELSVREAEALTFISRGFSVVEISELMGLSPHTVSTYIKRIYRKLQVHSRTEAVYEATQLGLIQPVTQTPSKPS